jgi:hypothetical protein
LKTPRAGIANAARGNGHRRTRKLQSPQAAFDDTTRALIINDLENRNGLRQQIP